MFVVIYSFELLPRKAHEFIEAWTELTGFISKFEGGLGSRLHHESENRYIAYAQWPDKQTWENAGSNLPEEAQLIRKRMHAVIHKMTTLEELTVLKDLLI